MPLPGVRTQERDLTVRNPDGAPGFARFRRHVHEPLLDPGRSPGTMETNRRGNLLAAGQVRQLWRQAVNYVGPRAFSSTANAHYSGRPAIAGGITRAVRYMARSLYVWGGTDNTRLSELHTVIVPRVRSKPVTVGGGQKRYAPTIRNRLTSFGSRVPPLNPRIQAAARDEEGGS